MGVLVAVRVCTEQTASAVIWVPCGQKSELPILPGGIDDGLLARLGCLHCVGETVGGRARRRAQEPPMQRLPQPDSLVSMLFWSWAEAYGT